MKNIHIQIICSLYDFKDLYSIVKWSEKSTYSWSGQQRSSLQYLVHVPSHGVLDGIRTWRTAAGVTTRFLCSWNVNSTERMLMTRKSSTFGLTTLPECGQFEDEAIRMRVRRRAETGEWSGPWIHMSLICITYSRRRGIIFGGVAPSGGCSVAEIWNLIHCPPLLAGGNYSLEHVRHRDRSSQLNLIEFIRLWLSDITFVTLFINSTPTPILSDGQCWSVSSSVEMRWHIMEWRMD